MKAIMEKHNKQMIENFNRLAGEYKTLSNAYLDLSEQSFQVETSPFKVYKNNLHASMLSSPFGLTHIG